MGLEKAIKETIEYAKKFGCNLSIKEIKERLISDQVYNEEEIDKALKTHPLRQLAEHPPLKMEGLKKEEKAKELAKLIERNFKDILFLGITGSVAAGYPNAKDDIDLLIITKPYRLWITRLKLRIFISLNRIPHRKFGRKENKDEFCFNLWLDLLSLKFSKEKQNLKNAVDLILLKKLINKDNTYEKFIKKNDWAKKFVATGYSLKPSAPTIVEGTSLDPAVAGQAKEALSNKLVNWLVFWPQYWYMKKRIKNEKIGLHKAFFHH